MLRTIALASLCVSSLACTAEVSLAGRSGQPTQTDQEAKAAPKQETPTKKKTTTALFFGSETSDTDQPLATWKLTGSTFERVDTKSGPTAALDLSACAFGDDVLLYGRIWDDPEALPETWTLDGTTWTRSEVPGPSHRSSQSMVGLGDRAVMFGGFGQGRVDGALADTWVWDGKNWTNPKPAVSPPARWGAAIGTLDGKAILFGGLTDGGSLADTWVWDGSRWSEKKPATSPPARAHAAMTFHDGALVLFGGEADSGQLGDAWTFDGETWTELTTPSPPSPRAHFEMVSSGGTLTVLGGMTSESFFDDVWQLSGETWTTKKSPLGETHPTSIKAAVAVP